MRFNDIEQFPHSHYRVSVDLDDVEAVLNRYDRPDMGSPLILNPEWQRGHVWSQEQKTAFIEYFLKGGTTGREIYFNCSSWGTDYNTPTYCVDGLQRLTAAMEFVKNEFKAFGHYYGEFDGSPRMIRNSFSFNVLCVRNKRDLLKVYIDFNSGGTPHNPSEIERIKKMLEETSVEEVL